MAGQGEIYSGSFMSYWIQSVMYYDLPWEYFAIGYAIFFAVLVLSYVVVRPERR